MDKYEYRIKTEQMLKYAEEKSYRKAMEIADTIDWRKVKNSSMLSTVSEIYENMGELQKAKEILLEDEITIQVDLNDGEFAATAYGCDLTYEYVKINGDYRS